MGVRIDVALGFRRAMVGHFGVTAASTVDHAFVVVLVMMMVVVVVPRHRRIGAQRNNCGCRNTQQRAYV
jgi:uncharacterized membrane protein